MVSAVVLAGYSRHSSVEGQNKALLELDGRWLIEYVLHALENARNIEDITIVGPKAKLEERIKHHKVVNDSDKFSINCLRGYDNSRKSNRYTFFIYSDIPLTTSRSIDYIIDHCKGDFDFFVPFATKKTLSSFEDNEWFKKSENFNYLKLDDGWIRTANSALVDCEAAISKTKFLQDIEAGYEFRKLSHFISKLKLLSKLGPYTLRHYFITKDLTLDKITNFLSSKTGISFKCIETIHPETSIDVDCKDDYIAIKEYMKAFTSPVCLPSQTLVLH